MKRVGIALGRGFTIIELIIVCIVIAVLATVTTIGYIGYQKKAAANRLSAASRQIIAGAEKYYSVNNDYPSGSSVANPDIAASTLGVDPAALKASDSQFSFCNAPANCTSATMANSGKIFYITASGNNTTTTYTTPNGCSLQFVNSAAEQGATSFAVAYQNPENSNDWIVRKGSQGSVTYSGFWCYLSAT